MDDVWGNAWSTPGSSDGSEVKNPITTGLKLNTFERDADDDTVDLGASSWNTGSGSAWGAHSNLWQAEAPVLDAWGSQGSQVALHAPDAEEEKIEVAEDEGTEESKEDVAPRTILPTPPQSPLPLPSPPSAPSPEETPEEGSPSYSPAPVPGSPDLFGSFESAEAAHAEFQHPFSLTTKSPEFPPDATDEPWGGAWGKADASDANEQDDETTKDEWERAQEAKRRQERKVPPQLLASLIGQWDEYAKNFAPEFKSDDSGSQSWRKGLDNVEGLTDAIESLVPTAAFPAPTQFPKSGTFRAFKESLRLTRSFALTRSSPMAHLYASKGSTDWERSVKSQKSVASDEWGWDLKHEPEEKIDLTASAKGKRVGGLLSFWSKKSSLNGPPAGDPVAANPPKSPTLAIKPTSPLASARTSVDISPNNPTIAVASPPLVSTTSNPAMVTEDSGAADAASTQPSAVSRFFNRFSRKPSASPAPSENDNRGSLALSNDDIAALSDIVPSRNSSLLHGRHDSAGSLEAMLSSPHPRSSTSKLPPPLAPPPAASPRIGGPSSAKSHASDSSFDIKMADAQLLDVFENMGIYGTGSGYTPVSFDLMDSAEERSPTLETPRSRIVPSAPQGSSSPPLRHQTTSKQSSWLATVNPISHPLPPSLPPPSAVPKSETRLSDILNPSTPPPQSPSRHSFNSQNYDNPLPPTPKQGVDDFSELFVTSTPSPSQLSPFPLPPSARQGQPSTPTLQPPSTAFTDTKISAEDLGDFGDFIFPSMRVPSQPKVLPRATNHKPTQDLVEKAASMAGSWPTAPPTLPQPLAPPPGQRRVAMSSQQRDLLGDDSPLKPPTSGVFATPALSPAQFPSASRSTSTSLPVIAPSPPPTLNSRSTTSSPLAVATAKPPTQSGLSAQDLSFFEGL